MLNRFFGQKPKEDPDEKLRRESQSQAAPEPVSEPAAEPPAVVEQRSNFLSRTRQLFSRLGNTVQDTDLITDELWDDLTEALLTADVGPSTSLGLIERLQQRAANEQMRTGAQVQMALREELSDLLGETSPLRLSKKSPLTVFLVIGVNGSGKTTSIAKMANLLKLQGHKVMLAAADTFRAAAIDQIQEWGRRIDVPVISQNQGSDPAAVVYDALQAATSRGYDILIVDTAGRLQTKFNLMEELKKINRIIQKFVPDGPHELLMVIDAPTGQNALLQARQFAADIGLTGVIITKMDGTAKGGFAFAVTDDLGVPIKFIGIGEKVGDLIPFEPQQFVAALFAHD
ncbi:signal recognition particle-docking protein FtsY [Tengunoibacter tsumagoiensis]|uniref:Signal recognition particle receptor FtsY n=1 Tax=Tengunoibacter tsumagoiensis TaxID=2014871 RepID=A0A401ZYS4_9CHLR|nr:signal recognition particle-docking protein FtsY [Tengunoibacter tsumagoiensis]GCE11990.1 signal recognition particle-docking protein FtsY [Tengunoibacter tsumagoiensis]